MERHFLDFLEWPPRSEKPRVKGFTTIGDEGYPASWVREMLEIYGPYVDFVKFTPASMAEPLSVVERKIQAYRDHEIFVAIDDPLFATAYYQGKVEQYFHALKDLGVTHVQIDTHHIKLPNDPNAEQRDEDEVRYTVMAREMGFMLIGEVGQKWPEGDRAREGRGLLNVAAIIEEVKRLLAADYEHVYIESRLLREAIGDYGEREEGSEQIRQVVEAVGPDSIFIEISGQLPFDVRMCHRFWAVRTFGPDVNMGGGMSISDVRYTEAIRRGITFVNGPSRSSSRLWVKSLARHGGKAAEDWWKEEYPIDPNFLSRST